MYSDMENVNLRGSLAVIAPLLAHRYHIVEVIGKGSFGVIVQAVVGLSESSIIAEFQC